MRLPHDRRRAYLALFRSTLRSLVRRGTHLRPGDVSRCGLGGGDVARRRRPAVHTRPARAAGLVLGPAELAQGDCGLLLVIAARPQLLDADAHLGQQLDQRALLQRVAVVARAARRAGRVEVVADRAFNRVLHRALLLLRVEEFAVLLQPRQVNLPRHLHRPEAAVAGGFDQVVVFVVGADEDPLARAVLGPLVEAGAEAVFLAGNELLDAGDLAAVQGIQFAHPVDRHAP